MSLFDIHKKLALSFQESSFVSLRTSGEYVNIWTLLIRIIYRAHNPKESSWK